MSTAALPTPARRRQRSVRLVVAVALLALSGAVVAAAFAAGALELPAAVLAVLCGAGATRITHTEVLQARRDGNRDLAEQARRFTRLAEERTARFSAAVADARERAADAESLVLGLEEELRDARREAAEETRRADVAVEEAADTAVRLESSEDRAADALGRVAELEAEVDAARAELHAWLSAPQRYAS